MEVYAPPKLEVTLLKTDDVLFVSYDEGTPDLSGNKWY